MYLNALYLLQEGNGELIFYDRPDSTGPKLSDYCKANIPSPEELNLVLSSSLGVKGVVEKIRTLFLYQQTRIHVDQVSNLGNFMELEVLLKSHWTAHYYFGKYYRSCWKTAKQLKKVLKLLKRSWRNWGFQNQISLLGHIWTILKYKPQES